MEEPTPIKVFAYWSNEGFEAIVNISELEADLMESAITGEPFRGRHPNQILNLAMLRARFNPHRCYEIYGFETTCDLDTLRAMSQDDPQTLVDLIREVGHCFHSSRRSNIENTIN